MTTKQRTWAIVLAAGEGTRLSTLTTDVSGRSIPKQYCSLDGGHSLLDEAMQRARRVVPRERLCVIVAEQHRRYWKRTIWTLPEANVIVQPQNRGTANGILLATLKILERDPLARIVFLPADHYVRDERTLAGSLRAAAASLTRNADGLTLVGIGPEEADPELGYIVPGATLSDGARRVSRFVEKPQPTVARELLKSGALWNSFIFAANGPALLGMIRSRLPGIVDQMATAIACETRLGIPSAALDDLYEDLPSIDFSRDIVQGNESVLRVIAAPACGWSDLGTPARVAETLRRITLELIERVPRKQRIPAYVNAPAFINLAAQHARLSLAG